MFNCKCFPISFKKKKTNRYRSTKNNLLKNIQIPIINNIETRYQLELIQKGGKSVIYKATKNKQVYIIKTNKGSKYMANMIREIKILKKIKHPRIINMSEYYQEIDKKKINIVMNFFQHDLFDYLGKNDSKLPENDIFKICQTILSILVFLQKKKIVHLDLKPENFVLNNNDLSTLTLIDFETAFELTKKSKTLFLPIGTKSYMSPEMALKNIFFINTDIWSLGIILYLCSGSCFFENNISLSKKPFQKYVNSIPSLEVSNNLKAILEKMLEIDPIARYDAIRLYKYTKSLKLFTI
jgi:serine/threonine protein kinase